MFCYGVAASRASLIINSFESVKILIQRHVSRSQLEEKACGCPGDCLTAYIFQITLGGRGQRILEWGAAIPTSGKLDFYFLVLIPLFLLATSKKSTLKKKY